MKNTADLSNISDGGFANWYTLAEFSRHSELCRALEVCNPGLRFNRVEAYVFALFRFENSPDADYVDVTFSLSGTCEALKRHGFHEPTTCTASARRQAFALPAPGIRTGRIGLRH